MEVTHLALKSAISEAIHKIEAITLQNANIKATRNL